VKLVVVTHWDDDHVQGISEIVDACPNANVACSAAIARREVIQFVVEQESEAGVAGSGLDELRTILRICRRRRRPIIWARANLPLHPIPPGDAAAVVALSPSDDSIERSITELIERAEGKKRAAGGRYKAPDGPNGASVATAINGSAERAVLAADLELSNNPDSGWEAVMAYARPSAAASLVKVAHHGSPGAHHDRFWAEAVTDEAVAIVAPWSNGGNFLPKVDDLRRLQSVAEQVYVTAMPGLRRVDGDPRARSLLRKLHGGKRLYELARWGQVRARRRSDDTSWRIELSGDAVLVT
jgi:hypothetical protein